LNDEHIPCRRLVFVKAAAIAGLLPEIYRDALPASPVLAVLLAIMDDMHAPVEALLAGLDAYFDPRFAPDALIAMMARWLALGPYLDHDPATGRAARISPEALRKLVAVAATCARLRGTSETLVILLELSTDIAGFRIIENPPDPETGQPQSFHIRVEIPAAAGAQKDLIARIVAGERPAWVTFELDILAE
jgi:phage tail-like protein